MSPFCFAAAAAPGCRLQEEFHEGTPLFLCDFSLRLKYLIQKLNFFNLNLDNLYFRDYNADRIQGKGWEIWKRTRSTPRPSARCAEKAWWSPSSGVPTAAQSSPGSFSPCRFCRLEEKHLQFVETFLRCRGSIKEVERALGVSYPTVKNMLDAALSALGLDEKPELRALREKEERSEILQRLSNGEIGVDTAIEALNQLKGGK